MTAEDPKLADLRAQLKAELALEPRATPWWVGAVVLVVVNAGLGAAAMAMMASGRGHDSGSMLRFGTTVLLGLVVVGGALFGVRPGSRTARLAMLGISALAVTLAVVAGSGVPVDGPFWAGTSCATTECLVSVVPMLTGLLLLSRFAFDPLRTIVVGMSAAAVGVLTLHLHCPNGSWSHLAMFHALPWACLIAALLLVRRVVPSKTFAP